MSIWGTPSGNRPAPVYSPEQEGVQGKTGETGPAGVDGLSTYSGVGPPTTPAKYENETYIDTGSGNVHKWVNASWSLIGNIRGPQGIQGPIGQTGPAGTSVQIEAGGVVPFVQSVPDDTWLITNPFPYRPNVTVYDNNGEEIFVDVDFEGNTIIISFAYESTGMVQLR